MKSFRLGMLLGAMVLAAAACGPKGDSGGRGGATEIDLLGNGIAKTQAKPVTNSTDEGPGYPLDAVLRLNEIQFKGTHNSYHLEPPSSTPDQRYSMPTLTEQLSFFGVRSFELDVHAIDGRIGVFHLPVGDDKSTCSWLAACLRELKAWSDAHPGHQPLVVYFDPRDQFDAEKIIDHLDDIDAELRAVWPRERMLTPDDLTRGEADVAAGVAKYGWPTLGETRGKILFVLWAFGDIPYRYTYEGTTLRGRAMFVAETYTGWRHSMIVGMDTAIEQEAQIAEAVKAGFFVRTRSDDLPSRGGYYPDRLAAALRSGAQSILTDYPRPGDVEGYDMTIPGGTPSRCNPQNAPATCTAADVENPLSLAQP